MIADHKINSPPHKCVRPYTLSQLLGEVGRDHFNINVMKLWIWCKHQNSSWDVKSRITAHWLRLYLIWNIIVIKQDARTQCYQTSIPWLDSLHKSDFDTFAKFPQSRLKSSLKFWRWSGQLAGHYLLLQNNK